MKIALTFVFLFSVSIIFSQSNDCKCFRTGKYTYKEEPYELVQIKRTKKIQTEYNPKDNLTLKFKIEWIDSCEYVLTYLSVSESKYEYLIGTTIKTKIHRIISENEYTYIDAWGNEYTILRVD